MMPTVLYPAQNVERKFPVNLLEHDKKLFEAEFFKHFDEVMCKTYTDVTILSNGISVKRNVLSRLFYGDRSVPAKVLLKMYLKAFRAQLFARKTVVINNVLLLNDHFSGGFFHWFGDVLQKIEALKQQNVDLSTMTLIIPSEVNLPYVKASLKPYDVRCFIIEPMQKVRAKRLLYIPNISPTGNFRPELMRRMRSRFYDCFKEGDIKKRVYITRSKALKRTIVNELALLSVLKKFGFHIVAMEELSFEAQYKVVAGAEILLGLHGAGLTHMLWLKQGATVVEIRMKDDRTNNCYFTLASDMGLKYYYSLADKTDAQKTTQLADVKVDPVAIEEILETILAEKVE